MRNRIAISFALLLVAFAVLPSCVEPDESDDEPALSALVTEPTNADTDSALIELPDGDETALGKRAEFGLATADASLEPFNGVSVEAMAFNELKRARGMNRVRLIVLIDDLKPGQPCQRHERCHAERTKVTNWVAAALLNRMTPYITVDTRSARTNGAVTHANHVVWLYRDLLSRSVKEFAILNEPNIDTWHERGYVAPTLAAEYYYRGANALHAICSGCVVVAGEFAGAPGGRNGGYMHDYVLKMNSYPRTSPAIQKLSVWSLHAYKEVTEGTQQVGTLNDVLDVRLADDRYAIWVTEAAVLLEQGGRMEPRGGVRTGQIAMAQRFLAMANTPHVRRVYWYELKAKGPPLPGEPDHPWDSGLLDWNGRRRPAFCVLAGRPMSECDGSLNAWRLTHVRWATHQGAYWSAIKWLSGDFNGDGRSDIASVFADESSASIDVHPSTGTAFGHERWATRQGGFADTHQWVSGDFDGDGRTDLACIFDDGGFASIDLHRSTATAFTHERWATRQGGFWVGQRWLAGDFDGDGRDDLANVFSDAGMVSIDIHLSSAASFGHQRWLTRYSFFGASDKWLAGDFNRDGRTDLAKVIDQQGIASISVFEPHGTAFAFRDYGAMQGGFWGGQTWVSGDFDGDGFADVGKSFADGFTPHLASIDVHRSVPQPATFLRTFQHERWATEQGGFWTDQKWLSGDFNGNGKADFANVFGDGWQASIDVHLR